MTQSPAFDFDDLKEQDFRDIILNISRLVKQSKINTDAYSFCAGYIYVNY